MQGQCGQGSLTAWTRSCEFARYAMAVEGQRRCVSMMCGHSMWLAGLEDHRDRTEPHRFGSS